MEVAQGKKGLRYRPDRVPGEARNRLMQAFDGAVERLGEELGKESSECKDQREKARGNIAKNEDIIDVAEERISFLENALEEWQEFLDEPGTPTPKEYNSTWRSIFGENSGFVKGRKGKEWWDDPENTGAGAPHDLQAAGTFFRNKVTDMGEQISDKQPEKIAKAQKQIVTAEDAIVSLEETIGELRGPAREKREAALALGGNPSEEDVIGWMLDSGFNSELDEVVGTEDGASFGGRVNLIDLIADVREERAVTEDLAKGRFRGRTGTGVEELVESEVREYSQALPAEGPLSPRSEPRDPMQIGLEEGLDAQRERQAQERDRRGQARVTDPRQSVPEFGPGTIKGSDGGGDDDGDPDPEGLDDDTRQYIIDNFSLAGFLLQLPDGELSAELEIPPGSGNMVQIDNVMAYINENGLTNQNEIKGLFLQTQWYNNTEPEHREWQSLWYGEGGEGFQTFAESNANQRALLDDKMDSIRREAERLGLNLDEEDLWKLAYEAQSMGFDTYEIREQFTSTYEDALFASDKGRFEATRNDIRDEAAQYMDTWTDVDLDDAAKRVYLGQTTIEEIEAGIRAEAKAANPALASLIDQGYTPKMYFASYKKEAENLLERNVDFLGGDRGLYNQLTGTEWDTEGARPMTRAEFGRTLRATPEWQYTDNARDSAYDAASQIARMFGGIG